jgi:hypothetical protein
VSNQFQDDTLRLHPWLERAYPRLPESAAPSNRSRVYRPGHCSSGGCSSAYSWESPESQDIVRKRLGRGLHQGHQVIGPSKEMRASPGSEGPYWDPLSCALSFFQSTREYIGGKVQQIFALISSKYASAQRSLAPFFQCPRAEVLVICSQNAFKI